MQEFQSMPRQYDRNGLKEKSHYRRQSRSKKRSIHSYERPPFSSLLNYDGGKTSFNAVNCRQQKKRIQSMKKWLALAISTSLFTGCATLPWQSEQQPSETT